MGQVTNPLADLQVQTEELWDAAAPRERRGGNHISAKQADLITKLVSEKDTSALLSQNELSNFPAFLNSLTGGWGGTGSKLIDALFNAPYRPREASTTSVVEADTVLPPAGYFGVAGKRYKVDAPEAGKWAGWIFFKSGSDYYEQQKLGSVSPGGSYRGKAEDVFRTIASDPKAAAEEYARITGACYVCNRKLEDPTSVSLGIGPVCRQGGGAY